MCVCKVIPLKVIMTFESRGDYLKQTPASGWKPPLKWLIRIVQEIPQTTQVIASALGCFPELEGETLLLNAPHTSDTGLGAIKLELTSKLPP